MLTGKCNVEKCLLCACSVSEERVGTWDHSCTRCCMHVHIAAAGLACKRAIVGNGWVVILDEQLDLQKCYYHLVFFSF